MFDWIFSAAGWLQFATLLLLEIILGIDNIIFLSLVVNGLPERLRARARFLGLALALIARLVLLGAIFWLSKLTATLFTLLGNEISGRDLVLIVGGGFLVLKSIRELVQMLRVAGAPAASAENASEIPAPSENPLFSHFCPHGGEANAEKISPNASAGVLSYVKRAPERSEGDSAKFSRESEPTRSASFAFVIAEIIFIDLIFSIDSVITAVGIAQELGIMAAAVVVAVIFMMFASAPVSRLIERFWQLKILALAFLVLVGALLFAEGLEFSIPRGYIYCALGFSLIVCALEIAYERRLRREQN